MANLFDQFLATQGAMRQNEAQDISNQFNLAKLTKLQADQQREAQTRQLGAQIAQAELTKQTQPQAVTLANLSEVPNAENERQGIPTLQDVAKPASVKPPTNSEVLQKQADDLKSAALKYGAIGNLNQQKTLMDEADKIREKLYLSQKEERTAKLAELDRAASAVKAVNSQESLNDFWDRSDPQHRAAVAGLFDLGLDGKPIYNAKAAAATEYIGNSVISAKDQEGLKIKALTQQLGEMKAETDRLKAEEQARHNTATEATARENTKVKAKAVEVAREKNDPFGLFSQGGIVSTSDGSRPAGAITLDTRTNRYFKDGLDVTDKVNNGEVTPPTAITQTLKSALGSNIHGDAFLKLAPPALQTTVQAIGEGRSPMPPQGRSDPTNKLIRSMVLQTYPDYHEGDYASGLATEKAFTSGRLGTAVKTFNVATNHLDSLQKVADALQNGDIPAFNAAGNYFAKQTGQPAPTDFNAVKKIVADEIVKAIVGGQNAVADREEAAKSIDAANSPAQLAGVIKQYKELMAGQLEGLQKQYESGTKKTDFRQRFLTPEAKANIDKIRPEANHPTDIQALLKKYGG
jgi:hypothetical protein